MSQTDTGASRTTGWDNVAAKQWVESALRTDDVEFPWNLTTAVMQEVHPEVNLVLDAASGPGGFLATVLDAFPQARGVWFDVSTAMEEEARRNLERFGDRVEYRIGDLVDIAEAGAAGTFDLVTSSRATHHLALPDLTRFYQQTAQLLAPNGWFANVDSMSERDAWRERMRRIRANRRAAAGTKDVSTHPQINVSPAMSEHFAAMRAAGFTEIDLLWKVYVTGLVMGRKIDPKEFIR
jgi:SAM-dependent methyltransferase